MNFLAGITVGFDPDVGVEELDLEGKLGIIARGRSERWLLRSAKDGEERDR